MTDSLIIMLKMMFYIELIIFRCIKFIPMKLGYIVDRKENYVSKCVEKFEIEER